MELASGIRVERVGVRDANTNEKSRWLANHPPKERRYLRAGAAPLRRKRRTISVAATKPKFPISPNR